MNLKLLFECKKNRFRLGGCHCNFYCGENFGNVYLIFLRADMKWNFDTKWGYLRDYPLYFKNKKVDKLLCTINYEFHLKITSCLINYISDRFIGLCPKL